MNDRIYPALLVCFFLVACGADGLPVVAPVADAPGSHGHNFSLAPLASFEMNETTPEVVKLAMGREPFDTLKAGVTFAADKKFVGRVSIVMNYRYSTSTFCYPQKVANFAFINGKLSSYYVFSELDGESHFIPDPQKLAAVKPGRTSRSGVLGVFGTPDFWATGISLNKDQPETLGYYWIAERKPRILVKRFSIIFNGNGIMMAPPVIDRNLDDLLMGRWLCGFPPPMR